MKTGLAPSLSFKDPIKPWMLEPWVLNKILHSSNTLFIFCRKSLGFRNQNLILSDFYLNTFFQWTLILLNQSRSNSVGRVLSMTIKFRMCSRFSYFAGTVIFPTTGELLKLRLLPQAEWDNLIIQYHIHCRTRCTRVYLHLIINLCYSYLNICYVTFDAIYRLSRQMFSSSSVQSKCHIFSCIHRCVPRMMITASHTLVIRNAITTAHLWLLFATWSSFKLHLWQSGLTYRTNMAFLLAVMARGISECTRFRPILHTPTWFALVCTSVPLLYIQKWLVEPSQLYN